MTGLELHVLNSDMALAAWPQIRPLVEKCVGNAYHGEMTTDDFLVLLTEKKVFAIAGFMKNRMVVIGIFEPIEYPRLRTLSCILAAGDTPGVMRKINAEWMGKLRAYARSLGFDAIECMASDAMGRVLRPMGYRKLYNFFRMDLR